MNSERGKKICWAEDLYIGQNLYYLCLFLFIMFLSFSAVFHMRGKYREIVVLSLFSLCIRLIKFEVFYDWFTGGWLTRYK